MATEDYTGYTEVDPNSELTVTASAITAGAGTVDDPDNYVYFDYGVDHFDESGGDILHTFDYEVGEDNGKWAPWTIGNTLNDVEALKKNDLDGYCAMVRFKNGDIEVEWNDFFNEVKAGTKITHAVDTTMYGQFDWTSAASGTIKISIFTDSARTTHATNSPQSLTGASVPCRYHFGMNAANKGGDTYDGISRNIDLNEAGASGAIDAVLPISFGVTADLKADGKLDAALATVYAIAADLKAQGKLDAALPVAFAMAADLKAKGKLDAVLPITLALAADLKAKGKLDAALGLALGVVANLTNATPPGGEIDAVLPIALGVTADLKADGKLDAALGIAFNVAADLKAKGQLDAALPMTFGVAADLKAQGKLDAALPISFAVAADLKAQGKLDIVLPMVFAITADLKDASGGLINAVLPVAFAVATDLKARGRLTAALPIVFNLAGSLTDASPLADSEWITQARRRGRR